MPTFLAPGLAVLDAAEAGLFEILDDTFLRIADRLGAQRAVGPALLPQTGLTKLDFFRNFPHLGLAVATFPDDAVKEMADSAQPPEPGSPLDSTGIMLPTATCYGLLLALQGRNAGAGERITAIGRCYRNEDVYDGLRRLRGFSMREVLYVGSQEGAVEHLAAAGRQIDELAGRLGIELRRELAGDPFFTADSSRTIMNKLDPVKTEFVATDGTAVASVNRHRNFFGERLDIRHDGAPAFTACVAFGVERWIHTLIRRYGSAEEALGVVRELLTERDDRAGAD